MPVNFSCGGIPARVGFVAGELLILAFNESK